MMQAALPTSSRRREGGQVLVLFLIVLAVLGGIGWWLFTSRDQSGQAARAFAREAGLKLGREHDQKFLDVHIGPEVQTRYPPSYRERLLTKLRGLGVASDDVQVEGDVAFTSHFFSPHGRFKVLLGYPDTRKAELYLVVSNPHPWWQIDEINLVWYPPATGAGAPPR
jgi:hypothetical protein